MDNCNCNPYSAPPALTRKRVGTDLFLLFDMQRQGKGINLADVKNISVKVKKDGSFTQPRAENYTIDGSRIAIQIAAADNTRTGVFNISIEYDVQNADSETGLVHVINDIPRAFEIVPLSTEETQGTLFVVSERDVKPRAGGRDGVDGHDGRLRMVNHGTNDTTFALRAGEMHVWGKIPGLSISIDETSKSDEYVNEFAFQFTCPDDAATTFIKPSSVGWYKGEVINPVKGVTYQGFIVNNILMMGGDKDEFTA